MCSDGTPVRDDFAEALTWALRERRMPLHRLQRLLQEQGHGVSAATLSYWKNGRSRPARAGSLETVAAIEGLLGLTPRTLTSKVLAGGDPEWNPASVLTIEQEAEQVMHRLGMSWNQPVSGIVSYDMFHTGRPDRVESQCVRQLVRADSDGVARLPAIFQVSGPRPPAVVVGDGVSLGEVARIGQGAGIVVEFLLPHALERGERHWFEYEVVWERVPEDVATYGRSVKSDHASLTLGVTFHGRPAAGARVYHQPPQDDPAVDLARWEGPTPTRLQRTVTNAPSGVYLLEWIPDEE